MGATSDELMDIARAGAERIDRAEPEGKAAELGLYEDLLRCVVPGEPFVEYGIVERRYEELRPEIFD